MKRFISVQKLQLKLKQNMESIFYHTFKVLFKVTFQSCSTYVSCSTKRGERAWQSLTCHIENVRQLFHSKPRPEWIREKWYSIKEEQCINQEETDEDWRKPKKSQDHTWLHYEKEAMFCYFCWKSKKTNPFASAEGCINFCPPKNKNVPQNFSQGDKLSPSDQIQAQPWCT